MAYDLIVVDPPNDPGTDSPRAAFVKVNAVITALNALGFGGNILPVKPTVKAASTGNLTLAGAQTIDGIACGAGDRVLAKDQSTGSQNGIYVVASGAWTRAADFDAWEEIPGAIVLVEQGTVNANRAYNCTNDAGGTLGSTAIAFVLVSPGNITSAIWGYLAALSPYMGGLLATASKAALITDLASTAQLQGFKNRLINGSGEIDQRKLASNADDTYGPDRWYVLTQTGAVAYSILTNPESGAPTGIRLTQSQASAQRMGIAQIVESQNCRDLRAVVTTLAGRVRLSSSADVRYAVLEWTGSADSVTSDVVNDWTSSTYTTGNFFISSNVNVLACAEVACTANTWRALDALNATLGASANNIIVFVWTEGTVAQNVLLDLNRVQWEPGAGATAYEQLPFAINMLRCQRYYEKSFEYGTAPAQAVGNNTGEAAFPQAAGASAPGVFGVRARFAVPKCAAPTVTTYNPFSANAQVHNSAAGADWSGTGVSNVSQNGFDVAGTTPGGSSQGTKCGVHWTASAEL